MARRLLLVVILAVSPRLAWPQGDPIGSEFRVNTYTTNHQANASVARVSGSFVVVWQSGDVGANWDLFGQVYAGSGDPLGPEFAVNGYPGGENAEVLPAVAMDSAGNFVAAWTSAGVSGSDVFGRRFTSTGVPLGPEFRVNTYTTGLQNAPAVASDASGSFMVVWSGEGQGVANGDVFAQRYDAGGVPLGPEFRVNTYTSYYQGSPSVASDSSGGFVVVWMSPDQDGSDRGIFGQRYSAGGMPLGPEFRVNTLTTGRQWYPSVAADPSGNFVVAWESDAQDGSGYGVYAQRYAGGVPLGPEFRVNTYTTQDQYRPAVASDASGNFVVAWTSEQDGLPHDVFGQRYDSSGSPLGPEFRVNTFTTSFQRRPAVAADPAGDFVIVWESDLQDGALLGVFGQRYGRIVPAELMRLTVE